MMNDCVCKILLSATDECRGKVSRGIYLLETPQDLDSSNKMDLITELLLQGLESLKRLEELITNSCSLKECKSIILENQNIQKQEDDSETNDHTVKIEDSVLPKNEAKLIENSDNDVDYEFDECGIKIEAPDSFYLVQDNGSPSQSGDTLEADTKGITKKKGKLKINGENKKATGVTDDFLTCDLCPSEPGNPDQQKQIKYKNKKELRAHQRNKHRPFSCDKCKKQFATNHKLKAHSQIHSVEKSFSCDICSKQFVSASNLYTHKFVHAERKFQCEVCSSTFLRKSDLKKHIFIHTGEKPFKCEYCSLETAFKGTLIEHVRTHTGEKPYNCHICPKTFRVKTGLNAHLRRHAGIKPYKCDVCSKHFDSKSHLGTHKRMHTGEKPFSCELCHKSFTRKANLREHMNTHQRS